MLHASARIMVLFSQPHNQWLSPAADDGSKEGTDSILNYSKIMINLHYRSVIYRSMSRPSYTRFLKNLWHIIILNLKDKWTEELKTLYFFTHLERSGLPITTQSFGQVLATLYSKE